ncbi:MAG: hypothetical protein IPJ77_11785 [Planctomycetes bacterium]|nr:hypothetical protein [Planctomycetota bacterium]
MKSLQLPSAIALLAGATFFLPGCDVKPTQAAPTPAPVAAVPAKPEATPERLLERANERWQKIVKADWIQAYDYLSPEQKRQMPISQYLQNKQNHRYENPKLGEVLRCDGTDAFLRMTVLWTPQHPKVKEVKLEPGQTLTQDVEMYESWRWAEGDWTYVRAQRPDEFFQDHPEFLRGGEAKEPAKTAEREAAAGK